MEGEIVEYPIDAVVAWVDGDDPVHKKKRMGYAAAAQMENDEVGGEIRYTSIGEIKYCIASLLRFAPFLRKIFIVTDSQDPHLDSFLDHNFPNRRTKVEVVDHTDIYRGYEDCLPVFNSLSIETMLWRIPGLSEHFIYLNDDFMLVAPTVPADYFENGKAVCYASRFNVCLAKFLRTIKPRRNGFKIFGFKDAMVNAADVVGEKGCFLYIGHIPLALRRSTLEGYYHMHPEIMERNMRPRFREPFQYNPQELFYLVALQKGDCVVRPRKGKDLYVKPKARKNYMAGKLREFDMSDSALFCCFNSLGYASESDRKLAIDWICRRLSINNEEHDSCFIEKMS